MTLALELENDLDEFELTMRGLLEVHADLHCGIFYVGENEPLDDVLVGVSSKRHKEKKRLGGWTPPWLRTDGWAPPITPSTTLLAIFVSESYPRVVGHRIYRPT